MLDEAAVDLLRPAPIEIGLELEAPELGVSGAPLQAPSLALRFFIFDDGRKPFLLSERLPVSQQSVEAERLGAALQKIGGISSHRCGHVFSPSGHHRKRDYAAGRRGLECAGRLQTGWGSMKIWQVIPPWVFQALLATFICACSSAAAGSSGRLPEEIQDTPAPLAVTGNCTAQANKLLLFGLLAPLACPVAGLGVPYYAAQDGESTSGIALSVLVTPTEYRTAGNTLV